MIETATVPTLYYLRIATSEDFELLKNSGNTKFYLDLRETTSDTAARTKSERHENMLINCLSSLRTESDPNETII